MNLLVIEGTGKQPTIKKFLGDDWEVFATKGHVRDLPVKTLGINLNNNFEPEYEMIPDKKSVVADLKKKVQKADKVYLATDPDREGEAISWHIAYILGLKPEDNCRVEFNEITKDVILNALKNPRIINQDLVNAQQARRVLDRLVGYKLSPILCKKIQKNLSAGRVQSVALKLVVDRENEILNFKPEEFWNISVELEKQGEKPTFKAGLATVKGKKIKINNKERADSCITYLKNQQYVVKDVKKTVAKSHAPAPFITSTLQQDALNKLGMSLARTTKCAQELYEGVEMGAEGKVALVTYIRTDSVRVSEEAQKKARYYIAQKYGQEYVPTKPNFYKSKESSQDAHEAIRPTHLEKTPESIKEYLSPENYKLYKLVYERFLASQMSEATFNQVQAEIEAGDCVFKIVGKTPKFAGFTKVYLEHKEQKEEAEEKLPPLEKGDNLLLKDTIGKQEFTKPAPRYTEASLIKAMEENGIGRPATYTPTVLILSTRKYVEKEGKALKPTELGVKCTELLQKYFSTIINVDFTANMETALDKIAEGEKVWQEVVDKFYKSFLPQLKNANYDKEKMPEEVKETDIICDKCGAKMVERMGRYGKFIACPNYPKCKNIYVQQKEVGKCPKCGKKLLERKSKAGKIYFSCEDYTGCGFMSWDKPIDKICPKCQHYLVEKTFKGSHITKCSNKECDYQVFDKIVKENMDAED